MFGVVMLSVKYTLLNVLPRLKMWLTGKIVLILLLFQKKTFGDKPADEKIFPERGVVRVRCPVLEFYTPCKISATANAREFKFCTRVGHAKS